MLTYHFEKDEVGIITTSDNDGEMNICSSFIFVDGILDHDRDEQVKSNL